MAWLLFNSTTAIYSPVIFYESQEWSLPAIVDVLLVPNLECPREYKKVPVQFFGVRTSCVKRKDHQDYKIGKCKSKIDETVPGIEPGHLKLIGGKSLCIKRGK